MRTKLIATATAAVLALTAANRAHETKLQQAVDLMETKGDLPGAIKLFEEVAQSPDRNLAARSLLYLGDCRAKLGSEESRRSYERVVREFADQREVAAEAQSRLAALRGPQSPAMTARQVWAGTKVDILGTVSPDGRYLSFVDWETGDLAVRDLAAGADRRLTNKGTWTQSDEFAEESAISRDGKLVAYSWFNKDLRYELRLANLAGDPNPRQLFDHPEVTWMAPYDWTSDGKWIAVQIARQDRTAQIGLIAGGDGALRVLKSVDWRGPTKMFFSPDGKYLAYDLPPGESVEERDVYVLAVDGSSEIRAVQHPATDVMMGWTPDGSRLLFASDRTGTMSVWALPIGGGKVQGAPELIKTDIGQPWSMGITRSGAMYFGGQSGLRDIHVASIDLQTGAVLSAPTRPILNHVGSNGQPSWSPDGKSLAYFSRRGFANRSFVLAIRSLDTGQTRELKPNLFYANMPRWLPDGSAIAVTGADRKGRQGIYRIDVRSGDASPVALSEPGVYFNLLGWSPDGSRVYYRRGETKERQELLIERDVASGKERELIRRQDFFGGAISPDGRNLLIREVNRAAKSTTLSVAPVSGGAPKVVLSLKEPESVGNVFEWTADSRGILFKKSLAPSGDPSELWMAFPSGEPPRKIALSAENIRQLRVHPDGRQIVYSAGDQKQEVWVLENFLPAPRASR